MKRYKLLIRLSSNNSNRTGLYKCSLTVDGARISSCNGSEQDVKAIVIGEWVEKEFASRLLKIESSFSALSFINPEHGIDKIGIEGLQAAFQNSFKLPTITHNIPVINGGCGLSSVEEVLKEIGVNLDFVGNSGASYFYVADAEEFQE